MLFSKFFAPINKEIISGNYTESHKYLIKAGFVRQLVSGIYSWLPCGSIVLSKIEKIISEEMNKIDGLKIIMPCIQPVSLWKESGRYDAYGDEMLRIKDRNDKEMLFGPTHEEVVSDVFRNNVFSYKSLPLLMYQITWKFRDEVRPRFGVMRSREFLMKDGYSFDLDYNSAFLTYKNIFSAYMKILKRLGLRPIAVNADSGCIGGGLSHEFHIAANTGESSLYYDKAIDSMLDCNDFDLLSKYYTAADEKHDKRNIEVDENSLVSCRGIEVGHIFYFDTKYSSSMNFTIMDQNGQNIYPHMGSYGIGVSRIVGAIVEALCNNGKMIWPESVAPFKYTIINLLKENNIANSLYEKLLNANIDVLYDDTTDTAGSKFNKAELIGSPYFIIVGKSAKDLNEVELEDRVNNVKKMIGLDNLISFINR